MTREWRDVVGYEGLYQVSNDGKVRRKPIPLKPGKTGKRKRTSIVVLCKNGKPRTHTISHLVLEAFVSPRPEGYEACHHPDPNPENNRVENLRWDTHQENINDRNELANGVRTRDRVKIKRIKKPKKVIRKLSLQEIQELIGRDPLPHENYFEISQ